MTEKEFEEGILALLEEHRAPENSADEDVLVAMKSQVEMKNNGVWGDGMALEVFTQFKWIMEQSKKIQD